MAKKKPKPPFPPEANDWRIALAKIIAAQELTPLDTMSRAMREYWQRAESFRQACEMALALGNEEDAVYYNDEKFKAIEKAVAVAAKAAPYLHPRLTSINTQIDTGPIQIELVRFSDSLQGQIETDAEKTTERNRKH